MSTKREQARAALQAFLSASWASTESIPADRGFDEGCGPQPGLMERLQRFRAEHDLEALDADSAFADVRDRAPGRAVKL